METHVEYCECPPEIDTIATIIFLLVAFFLSYFLFWELWDGSIFSVIPLYILSLLISCFIATFIMILLPGFMMGIPGAIAFAILMGGCKLVGYFYPD